MPALLLIIKNAIGALALYFAKRYAAELVIDVTLEIAGKLAKSTDSKVDDNYVNILKNERDQAVKIIKGFI